MRVLLLSFIISAISVATLWATSEADFAKQRQYMINMIRLDAVQTRHWIGKSTLKPIVFEAMLQVARHEFVPKKLRSRAYENRPLPIGYGQTISQPYIVALMTDLLDVDADDVVLEVGTGSGYQAAILAKLVKKVFTIEIIPQLAQQAKERLKRLQYANIETRTGDGYYGWEEHAPFDAIIVTAAAGQIPPPLIKQLKPGGRLAIPVGTPFTTQHLMLVEKDQNSKLTTRQVLPVRFVPLTGKH